MNPSKKQSAEYQEVKAAFMGRPRMNPAERRTR